MRESIKDEQSIMARFQQGDAAIFELVFKRYYKRLCYFTEGLTEDEETGRRIAIDSFVKLFEKCKDFNTLNNVLAFLYISAKNKCLNYLRSQKRLKGKERDFLYLQDEKVVELETLDSEVVEAIHAAVQSLPTQCRKVVEMLFYEEKKYSAIAIELGIAEATVRSQKRRAMELLKEKLGPQQFWIFLLLIYGGMLQNLLQQPIVGK